MDFQYSDPTPNFDRSRVKGLVASLIHLKEEDFPKSTALEITAGGRLYNVVVQDEKVGKDLLQNGKLKKRVTIIPLNKINAWEVPKAVSFRSIFTCDTSRVFMLYFLSQKLQAASRLAPGKVHLGLHLVGYDEEVSKAMTYVFGGTLICDDAESAKLVTFSREVGVKSVTLDGDVYDPSGTLSGGAAPSGNGILIRVQELQVAEGRLREARVVLERMEREAEGGRVRREGWRGLKRDLELKEHEMKLLEEQVGGSNATLVYLFRSIFVKHSSYWQIGEQLEATKKTIENLTEAVQTAKDKQKAAKEECTKLEKDMREFKDNKEGKIDELKVCFRLFIYMRSIY